MEVKLVIANGKAKGRAIPLPSTVVTIGRGKKCHLRPHCRLVSKLHCAIARWAGKVVVRDMKSSNGTFVNGERVHGEIRIQDGDSLKIGTVEFTFQIQLSPEDALPVQVVHPSEVKWLMDNRDGPPVLVLSDTCCDQDLTSLFETASAHLGPPGSSPELSAGDHLRDYFRRPR